LFNEVKSSPFQHVLTTHSDIFIDLGNWKTIKRLTDNGIYPNDKLLKKKYGSSVNLEKELRGHLDDIKTFCQDKTIFYREDNEMLFCDKCLLVEGPNDKYGLLALAKRKGYDWSKLTIISCSSKDKIHFYQTVCLAYGIKHFVVYDQDNKGKDSLIEELSINGNVFSFSRSFEELMCGSKDVRLNKLLEIINNCKIENLNKEIQNCLEAINEFLNK
jgi:predicted ATP-dependent endonuclease of OLD family